MGATKRSRETKAVNNARKKVNARTEGGQKKRQ